MLFYNFNNPTSTRQLIWYSPEPKSYGMPSWIKWLRIPLEIAVNVGIGIVTGGLGLVAGVITDFVLSTISDIIFSAAFNGGKIEWKEVGISAAFNVAVFAGKFARVFKQQRKANKLMSLVDNIETDNKELQTLFRRKVSTSLFENTEEVLDNNGKIISHYKLFDKKYAELEKELSGLTPSSFKKTAMQSYNEYSKAQKAFRDLRKIFVKSRSVLSLLTSPRYAAKKLVDVILKKPKKIITQAWNKWITKRVNDWVAKTGRKTVEQVIKNLPINSSWLESIKIYKAYNPWDLKSCNALLKFNKEATRSSKHPNGKEPVLLWNKRASDIVKLVKAQSPGKFYLDNFAYGWEIGKILRNQAGFIAMANIPFYATALSTIAFSYKTIYSIVKSFNKNQWLWTQNPSDLASEFLSGVKDNALKGWNFKYLKPIISIGRATLTNNTGYIIQAGLRTGSKKAWRNNFKKLRRSK